MDIERTSKISVFVGIDISKDKLDIHIKPMNEKLCIQRDEPSLSALVEKLRAFNVKCIVVEATGRYERLVVKYLKDFPIVVMNPRQIRDFARAIGKLAKTDMLDAEVIAQFAETIRPDVRQIHDHDQIKLKDLVTRRSQILSFIISEKVRLKQADTEDIINNIKRTLEFLKYQLAEIDRHIEKSIDSNDDQRNICQIIQTVPGVGKVSSYNLLSHLPELGQLTRKQIANLVGVAPINRDSGKLRGRRGIWGGKSEVRRALYMPALVATRHNAKLRTFYRKLIASGKAAKVAITPVMRKLIVTLNAMVRDKISWKEGV